MVSIKSSQGNADTESTSLELNCSVQYIPKEHRPGKAQYDKLLLVCHTVDKIYLKYRCQACTPRAHSAK